MKLPGDIAQTVKQALAEDVGSGDLTAALIPADTRYSATVISREAAVLCGSAWFDEAFRQVDASIRVDWQAADGDTVAPKQTLCRLHGPARALLTAERTALNLLQTLSGTATRAKRYADVVKHTPVKLLDTRKTVPGLRNAQKYAVTCGGCHNHRIGLYDGILIKENHIMAAGSIAAALAQTGDAAARGIMVEVEVENLEQLRAALAAGATLILLDNFDIATMRAAVQEARGRAKLEASGGITFDTLRRVAETGVDFISVGDLTKNVQIVDLSMRFQAP